MVIFKNLVRGYNETDIHIHSFHITASAKTLHVRMNILQTLKSHNSVMAYCNATKVCLLMWPNDPAIHVGVKQLKVRMGVYILWYETM